MLLFLCYCQVLGLVTSKFCRQAPAFPKSELSEHLKASYMGLHSLYTLHNSAFLLCFCCSLLFDLALHTLLMLARLTRSLFILSSSRPHRGRILWSTAWSSWTFPWCGQERWKGDAVEEKKAEEKARKSKEKWTLNAQEERTSMNQMWSLAPVIHAENAKE